MKHLCPEHTTRTVGTSRFHCKGYQWHIWIIQVIMVHFWENVNELETLIRLPRKHWIHRHGFIVQNYPESFSCVVGGWAMFVCVLLALWNTAIPLKLQRSKLSMILTCKHGRKIEMCPDWNDSCVEDRNTKKRQIIEKRINIENLLSAGHYSRY